MIPIIPQGFCDCHGFYLQNVNRARFFSRILDFYGFSKAGFFITSKRIKVKQKKVYFFLTRLEDRLLEVELREEELRPAEFLELELERETELRDDEPLAREEERLLERELTEEERLEEEAREGELRPGL
ncbi:MAG: hypothetical protein GQ544_10105 [Candidatus Aminicenantes bacterium]|nr:hypothetical protein [Candidatus Aminicenantes bacterium]